MRIPTLRLWIASAIVGATLLQGCATHGIKSPSSVQVIEPNWSARELRAPTAGHVRVDRSRG